MGFFVRPFIVKDPGVTGCPEDVSRHCVPVSTRVMEWANLEYLGILHHSIRPCPQARCGAISSLGGGSRVESHIHGENCWIWCSAFSSRRDWVSSSRSASSWMESEGAAFGRVVEKARTGFTLKGETRRRRASITAGRE